jgi:hypothetical protein
MKAVRQLSVSSPAVFKFRAVRAFKALDDGTRRKWIVVAAGRDLPSNLPLDANARVPNVLKNATCAEMRVTLLTNPDLFQVFNGGIVCTAASVEARQEGNEHYIEVVFDDDAQQGIVNGGHSYATLLNVLHGVTTYSDGLDLKSVLTKDARSGSAEIADLVLDDEKLGERIGRAREAAQVQIEFVAPVGDSEMLAAIARARNLSQGVEATALANLAGRFDLMKDVLTRAPAPFGTDLVNRIVWKTNQEVPEDSRAVPVKLLIQLLALMNTRAYQPGTRVANEVYSRAGIVVREFSEAEGDDRRHYDSLTRLLPGLIGLYDHIYASLPEIDPLFPWSDGKFDKERKRQPRAAVTPVLARPCATKVVNAFVWPIFAAFRLLLVSGDDGTLSFKTGPIEFFETMKTAMAESVKNFHRNQAHGVVHQVGKDKEIWVRLEGQVEMELKLRERMAMSR